MNRRTLMASSLSLLLLGSARAEEMPVPVELQGQLFKKILSFDRSLPTGTDLQLLRLSRVIR